MTEAVTKHDIDSFVKVFKRCCDEFGIDEVANKLYELSIPEKKNINTIIKEKIINEVCNIYSVKISEIFTSHKRSIIPARILCILLFNKHLQLTNRELAEIYNEHYTAINKKIRQFEKINNAVELKPKSEYSTVFNYEFINNYKNIDLKVLDYITIKNK